MPDDLRDPIGDALSSASVLVVDDEPGMRNFLGKTLAPRVARLVEAASPAEASAALDSGHFDVVVLDNVMPGTTGLAWLEGQRRKGFFADVVMITAYADLDTAIAALRAGVSDFVLKPFRANQIVEAVARTLDRTHLRRDNTLMRRELDNTEEGRLIGSSAAMDTVRDMLDRLAPLNTPVLFTGGSGTGKELAARHLHRNSTRAGRPFVAVNCATIPPDRIAEELFGTIDANGKLKPGLLLLANGGSLLLDEVASMPPPVQAALLRVLEDQRVRPLGAEREIPLNLRFLFASNADLPAAVEAGTFRADLFHRINVMQLNMPPLANRSEDISELAAAFIAHFAAQLGAPPLTLDDETLMKLRRYDWPGNVRELRNLIERSVILGTFPEGFAGNGEVSGQQALEDLELVTQRHILHVLDRCNGNRAEAARRLGVSRKTVDRKVVAWTKDDS